MLKILITGDYCPQQRIAKLIEENNFENIFKEIKPIIVECDYSIVNFECPVRTTDGGGIKKAGPSLKCSEKAVAALKFAGFQCVTLANNHFYDQGEYGVKETIQSLDSACIDHVGGGLNLNEAKHTLYKKLNGKTLAIINCCEHEFSIATEITGGSNPLDPIRQFYALTEAKKNADYIIVVVHGGIEHYQYPTPRMVETYHYFIDLGADVVINHHQHCFSGNEIYHGKPIFYGLGNFCFDWPEHNNVLWAEGFMVMLHLDGDDISYSLFPYNQNNDIPGVHLKNIDEMKNWQERFNAISSVIVDKDELQKKYEVLLKQTERRYAATLTPYNYRITLALFMRHFLPFIHSKKKLRTLLNVITCESHYDRFVHMLRNYSK